MPSKRVFLVITVQLTSFNLDTDQIETPYKMYKICHVEHPLMISAQYFQQENCHIVKKKQNKKKPFTILLQKHCGLYRQLE